MDLPAKFLEVLKYEGVVSVVTWTHEGPHITNAWNSYLRFNDENEIFIPAAGFTHAESDLETYDHVLLTAGARQVMGHNNYQGTGFRVHGEAWFEDKGPNFELMHDAYPFIREVLIIKPEEFKQLL